MSGIKGLPIVSGILVAINVIVFLLCTFSGNLLYNMGELSVGGVVAGKEFWRIATAMFLHGDINHLFNNMVLLFFMGAMIEKEVGHIKYAICFFLSGIGGNLLSLMYKILMGEMAASLGASGAIFGLDGLLLALVLFSKRKIENVTPARVVLMIALSLYSGFTGANIDNAAHVGGLLTGLLLGILLCGGRRRETVEF
ncbi:MAG: rhomboid family intramembrane serine protease [Acetatifactor sp.]|nr:rhomboid family intramembrane serine protease [Acetatifactor sp.]